jgi:hypothetical protein
MINRQLELGLSASQSRAAGRRRGRAHWWFERMRGLVEEAHDWQPAPDAGRPATPGVERLEALESGVPPRAATGRASNRWKFVRLGNVEES